MKPFNHSELSDFLEDESFQMWVSGTTHPGVADEWEQYPLLYPHTAAVFSKAKETLLAIQGDTFVLPPSRVRQNIRQILEDTRPVATPLRNLGWYQTPVWRWAAVLLLAGVVWLSWQLSHQTADPSTRIYHELVAKAQTPLVEVVNTSEQKHLVLLADGSSVLLMPQSRISYPKQFNKHAKREVYLTGEAFFEVAKNPEKPFFVYADKLITKVLGTSFTVRADGKDEVHVMVKTGKVSVFSRSDKERLEKQESCQLTGLVLTPNQRVQFNRTQERLIRSLVESPTLLDMPIQHAMFEFNGTPIAQVFASLEKAYGIEIIFDADVMKNCYLTASLDDAPLFEKLSMICRTLDAQYEQMEGKILITSKGCQ